MRRHAVGTCRRGWLQDRTNQCASAHLPQTQCPSTTCTYNSLKKETTEKSYSAVDSRMYAIAAGKTRLAARIDKGSAEQPGKNEDIC